MTALRVFRWGLWSAVIFGLVALGALTFTDRRPTAPASNSGTPSYGAPIPLAFRLTDHNGRAVSEADLKGNPLAVFFGFTFCPEICPTTLTDLTQTMAELGPAAARLTPVFVSVDPERDTPKVLAEYLQAFDPRTLALTGPLPEIERVAKAFGAYFKKMPTSSSYTMDHTAIVYLVDSQGRLSGSLDYHEDAPTRLAKLRRFLSAP